MMTTTTKMLKKMVGNDQGGVLICQHLYCTKTLTRKFKEAMNLIAEYCPTT